MTDLFQIGSTHFEFAPDSAVEFSDGGMRFELRAQPIDGFAPGFRSGAFGFTDKYDEPYRVSTLPVVWPMVDDFYIWEEGFEFGAKFFGQVTVTPQRIELRGVVRHDYEDEGPAVHIVRTVTPQPVTLGAHTYGNLDEALSVEPTRVRRILFRDWDGHFPDELRRFTELQFLSLEQFNAKNPDTEMPHWIGDLTRLTHLYLRSTALTSIPDRLGELAALEVLSLDYCSLTALPDGLARLTNLQRLLLNGNRLTSLPDWVAALSALKTLSIEGNPFESLPQSLDRIAHVNIEKKYEALFRDITYRPDLAVTVDREQFLARSSPAHAGLLTAALQRHGLTHAEQTLLTRARRAVRLRTTDADEPATIGGTRIGGAPDLPADFTYPMTDGRHWLFLAQLNLDELAPLQPWLPRTGRLYFFGEGQEHGDGVLVVHSDAPTVQPYRWPADAEFTDDQDGPYAGFRVRADATVSVPDLYRAHTVYPDDPVLLGIEADDDLQKKAYWALQEELTGNTDRRSGAHTLNAYVFTQNDTPQDQASRAQGGLPEEWITLLTLDSDTNPGFCFWDAGTFTVCIHEKDLAVGDFSRVQWSLESS